MSADAVAIASLILTAIGAVAACIAAYFSWKAPSKRDLARVEQNTALTSGHLENVHSDLASMNEDLKRVEGNTAETSEYLENVHRSLKTQEERDALNNKAQRVSMTASGWTEVTSPMQMTVVLTDPDIVLTRVGLYNEVGNFLDHSTVNHLSRRTGR
jgi:septal ring factor EnvC (AmiA/AmiB activator)